MSKKLNKDWLRTVMPTATILNDDVLCAEMLTIAAAAEERGRFAAAVVCKCGDELQRDDGAICGACLQPEIAEAEERGRRAGIKEAAKMLDAKIDAQKSFSYYVTDPRGGVSRQEGPHDLLLSARGIATEIRSLAPRDSGPAKRIAQHGNWDDADLAEEGK